jgi:hypothetical protein
MLKGRDRRAWGVALSLVALLFFAGCAGEGEVGKAEAEPHATTDRTALLEKLSAADELDGVADRVVSKCGGCALTMDGSEENVLEVAGYEMRFCSKECKDKFARNPEDTVLTLTIPGS